MVCEFPGASRLSHVYLLMFSEKDSTKETSTLQHCWSYSIKANGTWIQAASTAACMEKTGMQKVRYAPTAEVIVITVNWLTEWFVDWMK